MLSAQSGAVQLLQKVGAYFDLSFPVSMSIVIHYQSKLLLTNSYPL